MSHQPSFHEKARSNGIDLLPVGLADEAPDAARVCPDASLEPAVDAVQDAALRPRAEDGVEQAEIVSLQSRQRRRLRGEERGALDAAADQVGVRGGRVQEVQIVVFPETVWLVNVDSECRIVLFYETALPISRLQFYK